jgi:HAMP domain-containing protein
MRLLIKLNVILVFTLVVVWIAQDQVFSDKFIEKSELARVSDQAQLMIQEALAVRKYTEDQIQPLVHLRRDKEFHSQWVPFYAAQEVFKNLKLQERYKDFDYKEAAINPTNLNDRADGWESNMIRSFQITHVLRPYMGKREDVRAYAVVNPIPVTPECLQCHGRAQDAPPEMLRQYQSSTNGFGWKSGDIAGAQIVYVPTSVSDDKIQQREQFLITYRLVFFLVMLVVANLAVWVTVIRPLNRLAANAEELSEEHYDIDELELRGIGGRDEITDLADSFNRLHRSVKIAIKKAKGARPPE